MSATLDRYREAARQHDAEPQGVGRLDTLMGVLRAIRGLSDVEHAAVQREAWERLRRTAGRRG